MRATIAIIKFCIRFAVILALITWLITVNIETGFIKLGSIWISNNFLLTVVGGSFASMLVVLICEVQKYIYTKNQNEQSMFISSSGEKTIHADPHGGNVFVSFDAETQTPKITYIDTGNVITRTNSEILSDISLSLNMLIGNSEGIAASLLDGATLPTGSTKDEMVQKVAQLLDLLL